MQHTKQRFSIITFNNNTKKKLTTKISQYNFGLVPSLCCKFTTISGVFWFIFFFKAINSIVSLRDLLILMPYKNVTAFIQMLDISVLLTHLVLRWFALMVLVICEIEACDKKLMQKQIRNKSKNQSKRWCQIYTHFRNRDNVGSLCYFSSTHT